MIGPEWAGDERQAGATRDRPWRCAVVTGSRADFGLLTPVMHAIGARDDLELLVVAAGAHLIQPALTFRDVKKLFAVADSVPMQTAGKTGRLADVEALGKGSARFGRSFDGLRPDWVVVLGDRIEAFAAASAASVGGHACAHIHGGDRAEGVADEAMRHAITKLSHLHLAATETSASRILKMGERPEDVRVVGSPAVDGLDAIEPIDKARYERLGSHDVVLAMHPIGRTDEAEEHAASQVLAALEGKRVLALHPNHDPGREGVMRALLNAGDNVHLEQHLVRDEFVGALKAVAERSGIMIGNSSAGLIEAAALGLASVDIGQRQAGRERAEALTLWAPEEETKIRDAVVAAAVLTERTRSATPDHPFGDGRAGERIAAALAEADPHDDRRRRKQNAYRPPALPSPVRILLTNDDGIDAPGIRALHAALLGGERGGHGIDDRPEIGPISPGPEPVFTVAPMTVQSATSHGVTFHEPLMTRPTDVAGHPGVAVDGRPADCVKVAVAELWPERYGEGARPDIVISGMNAGANVGINVIYSGTVAAAIEAAFLGVPAIAVSMHMGRSRPMFDVAARHARRAIERVIETGLLEPHTVVNVNIPRCEDQSVPATAEERAAQGLTAPAGHTPAGATGALARSTVSAPWGDEPYDPEAELEMVVCPVNVHGIADRFDRRQSPSGQAYYWAAGGGFDFHATDPGTDVEALFERKITVTPLRFDLTDVDAMREWADKLG